MPEHVSPDDWDDLLELLADEGEIRLSDIECDTDSERARFERVLRQVEELGWVEETDDGVWTPGWKAEIFTNPGAVEGDITPEQ